jgi:hypothetical protein
MRLGGSASMLDNFPDKGPGKVGDGEVDVHLGNPGLGDIPSGGNDGLPRDRCAA